MALITPDNVFSAVSLCGRVAKAEKCAFVVIEVDYHHGLEATLEAFPSLDPEIVDPSDCDEIILRFEDAQAARDAFTRLSRDLAAAQERLPGAVDAGVRYVGPIKGGPVIITTNTASLKPMHVFVGEDLVTEGPRPGDRA